MDQPLPSGLKATFLVHSIVAGLIGIQHLVFPRVWTNLAGIEIAETVTWRVIGAALLGFAVGTWMAYREQGWERVRTVVAMMIVWPALGALAITWGLLFEGLAPLEWLNVVILGCFTVAFAVFYSRMRAARPAVDRDRRTQEEAYESTASR